ncbi:hypothetical protein QBC35DRAFT_80369 [Podospora australis]|uniref:Uncharacterized protein n=1 Tax=Podospora australis TaxID=1536484 RepID=A0AAN6WZA7_9PEZI|nr:hypothetical protein QBC35DRAFT_80369 [Podospora australis]
MSTAVAMAPSPAPHDRPSFGTELPPITTSPTSQRTSAAFPPPPPPPSSSSSAAPNAPASSARTGSGSPKGVGATESAHKSSPPSASRNSGGPKIIVKKEPGSPDIPTTARHRPRKLDLSKNTTNLVSPATGRPLTARDGGLGIQEVGLACLSPGFVTQDPVMKEQLQRSMSVREHQRQIIEQRLQQQSAKGDGPVDRDGGHFTAKTPGLARKRGPPPGLSIVAPSHEQFANERVIQSAPLGQTFTGRHNPHPLTRHITNQPSNLARTSHIHHVPATQTNNRLPPIADVFGQNLSGHPDSSGHALFTSQNRAPLASPHHPPPPPQQQQQQQHHQPPTALGRPREYKSAEEVQVELAGGRPELLPKLVHYAGQQQPPTPPSPPSQQQHARDHRYHADAAPASRNSNGSSNAYPPPPLSAMKRSRADYEDGSPPLGNGGIRPAPAAPGRRSGPFGEGRDSPDTQRAKREEFLKLCERAWDLFHS